MSDSPFEAVRAFERALAAYTGSKYACATTSCTDALLVSCAYLGITEVEIPKRTFVGVPQAIMNVGGTVRFRDENWTGGYQLKPYPIYDMARRTRAEMFIPGSFMCLSFHVSKICGFSDGGAILYDDDEAHGILHQMCYDGRPLTGPYTEEAFVRGFHCYMAPSTAAGLHRKLSTLPRDNADLPEQNYFDLSRAPIFRAKAQKLVA